MSFSDFDPYNKLVSCKIVLLGESSVGKSSLVLRFCNGYFHEFQGSTIGANFVTQAVVLKNGKVKFEIWDTAGQERFRSLAPMYYRGAQVAIVVYDITSMESFEKAKSWVTELYSQGSSNIIIALVGNKLDLEDSREVSTEITQTYTDSHGLIFYETSAKTAKNVKELFIAIAQKILSMPLISNEDSDIIPVANQDRKRKHKKCC